MVLKNFYYDNLNKKFVIIDDNEQVKIFSFDNSVYITRNDLNVVKEYVDYLLSLEDVDIDKIGQLIKVQKTKFTTLDGTELVKVKISDKVLYQKFLEFLDEKDVQTFGDYIKKYGLFIFEKIESVKYNYWFLDIEVLTVDDGSDSNLPTNPEQPIISIQIYNFDNQRYYMLLNNEIYNINTYFEKSERFKKLKENVYEDLKFNALVYISENEKEMLELFLKLFKKLRPAVISGWYSNHYDIPYLVQRMKLYDIFRKWKFSNFDSVIANEPYFKIHTTESHEIKYYINVPLVHFVDYRDLYEKFMSKPESWSLNYVSKLVLGDEGGKVEKGFLNFDKNLEEFYEYIIRDVELLVKMEDKLKLLELLFSFNEIIPIDIEYLLRSIVMIEAYLNYFAYHNNILLPFKSKKQNLDDDEEFEGAFVKQPDNEIKDNVVVFDFESMYPNIIKTFNVSFETLVVVKKDEKVEKYFDTTSEKYVDMNEILDEKTRNKKHIYYLIKKSLIREMVEQILDSRKIYKERYKQTGLLSDYNKQLNYKILANSIYGVFGTKGFTFYNTMVSSTITGVGRYLIKSVFDFIERLGTFEHNGITVKLVPVYGDTDSIFVQFIPVDNQVLNKEIVYEMQEKLKDIINSELFYMLKHQFKNMTDEEIRQRITLRMQVDKVFRRVKFFGVKKRYYGYDYDGNLIYKGVDLARSDSSRWLKNVLKEMYDYFLEIGNITSQDVYDEVIKKLKEKYYELKELPYSEIGDYKTVNTITSYKVIPYHIRGLMLYQKLKNITNFEQFVGQKVIVLPVVVKKDKVDSSFFNFVKKLFNEKRKNIDIIECYISIPTTESENSKLSLEYVEINYIKIFETLIKRIEPFVTNPKIIESVLNDIYIMEQSSLFNILFV